eukprot:513881-Amphidinium_carterae.1
MSRATCHEVRSQSSRFDVIAGEVPALFPVPLMQALGGVIHLPNQCVMWTAHDNCESARRSSMDSRPRARTLEEEERERAVHFELAEADVQGSSMPRSCLESNNHNQHGASGSGCEAGADRGTTTAKQNRPSPYFAEFFGDSRTSASGTALQTQPLPATREDYNDKTRRSFRSYSNRVMDSLHHPSTEQGSATDASLHKQEASDSLQGRYFDFGSISRNTCVYYKSVRSAIQSTNSNKRSGMCKCNYLKEFRLRLC